MEVVTYREEYLSGESSSNTLLPASVYEPNLSGLPMPPVSPEDAIDYPTDEAESGDVQTATQHVMLGEIPENISAAPSSEQHYSLPGVDVPMDDSAELLSALHTEFSPAQSSNSKDLETVPFSAISDGALRGASDFAITNGHASDTEKMVGLSKDDQIEKEVMQATVTESQEGISHARTANIKKETESSVQCVSPYSSLVDTAAPFESVKEAVTKFGGIVDWKAHKARTVERRKQVQEELEKVRGEIPVFKGKAETALASRAEALEELEHARRLVEELKHNLERALTEESQAKQDCELAKLRAKEKEQGVADEASVVAKTQLEVTKARHVKAVSELNAVNEELGSLQKQYVSLVDEKDAVVQRAADAVYELKELEKRVEELTIDLIASKEALELAHAAHLEAEDHRIGAALAKEQDCLGWDKELKQAEAEVQNLKIQLSAKKDLKVELEAASSLLLKLNAELAAYMETTFGKYESTQEVSIGDDAREIQDSTKEALLSEQTELEIIKRNIEKVDKEVKSLTLTANSLRLELDNQKGELLTMQQREGMASIAVSSLEAELNKTKQDIEMVKKREMETREKMVELPKLLQQAALEAEEGKLALQSAQNELRKAREEAEQMKASARTAEIRLLAVLKEIEATKASQKVSLAAIKALQESEEGISAEDDSPRTVTVPIQEYLALSKRAHDAEELAHEKVAAANALVKSAKEEESRFLEKLAHTYKDMARKKEAYGVALGWEERANDGKLAAEQDLRKWRAESEQRRKANEASKSAVTPFVSRSFNDTQHTGSSNKEEADHNVGHVSSSNNYSAGRKLKKQTLSQKFVTLLSRKNTETGK